MPARDTQRPRPEATRTAEAAKRRKEWTSARLATLCPLTAKMAQGNETEVLLKVKAGPHSPLPAANTFDKCVVFTLHFSAGNNDC